MEKGNHARGAPGRHSESAIFATAEQTAAETGESITGTILVAVLAAFGFLHREMRRGFASVDERFERTEKRFDEKLERMGQSVNERFERIDERFERINEKFDGLRTVLASVQVSVARIEGHLGIGLPSADEPREPSERPDCAA